MRGVFWLNNSFFSSANDTQFSLFRGSDLLDLIVQILNFDLSYRDKLGLSDNNTFGVEIEFERYNYLLVSSYLKRNISGWCCVEDGSLVNGGEVNSSILRDDISSWRDVSNVCYFLKRHYVDTLHNAGGHVHVGGHILGSDCDKWRNFIKLYVAYENVLFRFFYGDKVSGRKRILRFAPPIGDFLCQRLDTFNHVRDISSFLVNLPYGKYQSVAFFHLDFASIDEVKEGNTLEFRMPNGTVEEVIWQNYVNTCVKMMIAYEKGLVDEEFLDYKIKNERVSSIHDFCLYPEVDLAGVLEFVDMVFDNDLDKVYFLRQYFRNFEDNVGLKCAVKSKKFFK